MERTTTIDWHGRPIEAADPAPIASVPIELSAPTIRATERAAATVEANVDRGGPGAEVAGRLLLRAEGLSSSAIEGLRASAQAVALAERGGSGDPTASWVADNLAVVADALNTEPPLTIDTVLAWHTQLMRHATGFDPAHIGVWRPVLGWIGGGNPFLAAHVASPPDLIAPAMDDLIAFLGRDDIDPVTMAAVAHAQFETIHPFADGNGRIGRVLIGWILATQLDVAVPPPVSTAFARDIGGYTAGLTLYRQGNDDHWIRWFANTVIDAAERTAHVLDSVQFLQAKWHDKASHLRADATARAILDLLAIHPVLSSAVVVESIGVSLAAARLALKQLTELGILTELEPKASGRGRPTTWWAAQELVTLLGP